MTFLMMLAASVLIGWFAQTKKGRTGVTWALGSMALMIGAWIFMSICIGMAQPGFLDDSANSAALSFLVIGGGAAILGLAVASLPKRAA